MIKIGNAPCSWGVEFADDPRNPAWRKVLQENAEAGYTGIELGPVGFMPEDPAVLGEALSEFNQELVGGVVFRPFHDASKWDEASLSVAHLLPVARMKRSKWTKLNGLHFVIGSLKLQRLGPKSLALQWASMPMRQALWILNQSLSAS